MVFALGWGGVVHLEDADLPDPEIPTKSGYLERFMSCHVQR